MTPRDHRPALNCLRALSALVIVVYHFRYYSDVPIIDIYPWMLYGNLGVDFFFVLSGLIISHVYHDAFASGKASYAHFLYLRVSRLLPVHALIMVLMLVSALAVGKEMGPRQLFDWFTLTIMLRQWLLPEAYIWNTAAWSVSAEMFAYAVVFPVIIALTRKLRPMVAGALLIAGGWAVIGYVLLRHGVIHESSGAAPLLRVTAGFMIGAGLYRLLAKVRRSVAGDWLLLAGAVVVWVSATIIDAQVPVVLGVVLMIAGAYLGSGPITAAMARPIPNYLGEISFSFYLVHIPLMKAGGYVLRQQGLERGPAYCVAVLVASLLAAALLYEVVELPARKRMRDWWSGRKATRTGAGLPEAVGA